MKDVGEFLRSLREAAGLTQGQLAEEIGVGAQYISNIERGITTIPVYHWEKLGHVLNVSLQEILRVHVNDYRKKLLHALNPRRGRKR